MGVRISVKRVTNELDLERGVYMQALVLTDGKKEVAIPLSDAAFEAFMVEFRGALGALSNPEEATALRVDKQAPERTSEAADVPSLSNNLLEEPADGWSAVPEEDLEGGSDGNE